MRYFRPAERDVPHRPSQPAAGAEAAGTARAGTERRTQEAQRNENMRQPI